MGLDMTLYVHSSDIADPIEVAYWRKFNALHNWFTQFFADDEDNCVEVSVPRVDLEELLTEVTTSTVLHKPFLTPTTGFFFGSNEFDEYYWECCRLLITELSEILNKYSDDEFYYEADY